MIPISQDSARRPAGPALVPPARQRQAHDTAVGCRERAAADLAEAETMSFLNGRVRLESSAAAWTARANLLQRLDDSFQKRTALDAERRRQAEARAPSWSEAMVK